MGRVGTSDTTKTFVTSGARNHRPWRCASLVSGSLLALLGTSAAEAQVPGEELARRAFEEGVVLEKKGDYSGALAKFRESEQIKSTLGNRYHKAYCLEMTGKLSLSLIEYEIVDKTARETNKPELVDAARLRIEPLRTKIPQLSLKLAPSPKETAVALDGAPVSPALLDGKAFRIDPGEHVVTARAPDYESYSKAFTAPESSTTSVEIVMQKANGGKNERVPGVSGAGDHGEEAGHRRSLTLPILSTAAAVVLAGGGFGAYVLSGSTQDDLQKKCAMKPSCDDDKGATRTLDAIALGAWIGAAGLAALSIVLWTSKPNTSASTSAKVVARSSWVGVEGRF